MTNEEIVARAICKNRNNNSDSAWVAYQGEAHIAVSALSSAGRLVASAPHPAPDAPCKDCTGYWYDNGVLHCDDECPAPDATDWKALCGAAVMERDAMRDKCMGCIMPAEHADALTAAQAENEKLREELEKAEEWNRLRAQDIVTLGHLAGQTLDAQAENEKLRELLEPLLDHYLHCYGGIHDQLATDARAALPPPLSPEKE